MKPVRIIGSGSGEVLEWLIRPVSKTGKPQKGFVGSNPTLSAIERRVKFQVSGFRILGAGSS